MAPAGTKWLPLPLPYVSLSSKLSGIHASPCQAARVETPYKGGGTRWTSGFDPWSSNFGTLPFNQARSGIREEIVWQTLTYLDLHLMTQSSVHFLSEIIGPYVPLPLPQVLSLLLLFHQLAVGVRDLGRTLSLVDRINFQICSHGNISNGFAYICISTCICWHLLCSNRMQRAASTHAIFWSNAAHGSAGVGTYAH